MGLAFLLLGIVRNFKEAIAEKIRKANKEGSKEAPNTGAVAAWCREKVERVHF